MCVYVGVSALFVVQLGWTPLMEASSRGHDDAMSILLHKGANTSILNNVCTVVLKCHLVIFLCALT